MICFHFCFLSFLLVIDLPIGSHSLLLNKGTASPLVNFRVYTSIFSRCDDYAISVEDKPRWGGRIIGPISRYINAILTGSIFYLIFKVLNKFTLHEKGDAFLNYILRRDKSRGLLTASNHMSFYDDPGLWAALLPWWAMSSEQMRWSLCTDDVFFANKYIQKVFGAGNVLPIDRSGSIDQPAFRVFKKKLDARSWCHIFPEGKVRQRWRYDVGVEPVLGEFRYGVGKLIAHATTTPIVLPIYHVGMDDILPENVNKNKKSRKASKPISLIPRMGKSVHMYIGEPIDFTEKVRQFRALNPGVLDTWESSTAEAIELYVDITNRIRAEVIELEAVANKRLPCPSSSNDDNVGKGGDGLSLHADSRSSHSSNNSSFISLTTQPLL